MSDHRFHETIGKLVNGLGSSQETRIWLDPACGGAEVVPFTNGPASEGIHLCHVDILILAHDRVVVIEIEESDVKPLHLFGKFYASAFSTYFNDKEIGKLPLLFIQVLDTKKVNLKEGQKAEQWDLIEEILGERAEEWPDRTVEYRLFKGREADFKPGEKEGQNLIEAIEGFLGESIFLRGGPEADRAITIRVRSAWGTEQRFQIYGGALKFQSAGPPYDMSSGRIVLSQPQLEAIEGLLRKVRVGPVPVGPIGLDGETTTVTIRGGENRLELEYWEAPKPWKPVEKLVEMVRALAGLAGR